MSTNEPTKEQPYNQDYYDKHPYGVEALGPGQSDYKLVIEGYEVPYLRAHELKEGDEQWALVLDERALIFCTDMEMRKWVRFIADAMAVAAGYTSFGVHCQPRNPFTRGVMQITSVQHEGDEPTAVQP